MSVPAENYKRWAEQTRRAINSTAHCEYFNIAGLSVCIRLQHQVLKITFLMAIKHLQIPPCKADYLIDVWDCSIGDCSFPDFEYGIDDIEVRGEVPNYSGDNIEFAYFAHASMAHILNEKEKHAIVAVRDASQMPRFELACPFRGIFSWMLRNNKRAIIHSAALADQKGHTYLILGKSGAGKSSTAISCFLSGMKYVGDDLCALGLVNQQVHVYSLYSSGKTFRAEWQFLPELQDLAVSYPSQLNEKEVYFFGAEAGKTCVSGCLKKIFVPTKNPITASVKAPPIASLMSQTIDSTRELLPGAGFEALTLLYAAFKQAPIELLPLREDRTCPILLND